MNEPILVKLKMKKGYKSILSLLGLLIILVAVIGIMYLFYDKIIDDSRVEANGVLSINYNNGKKFNISDAKTFKVSVTNESENIAYFAISFNDLNGTGTYNVIYNNASLMEGDINTFDKISSDYISLDAKETKAYEIEIKTNDKIKGSISIDIPKGTVVTFADTIMNNNKEKEPLTKVGTEISTSDEGLIKSSDDLGVSYYFRGNVINNYVSFGGFLWRIVRINGDGTVRLVLNDVLDNIGSYYTEDNTSFDFKSVNMNTILTSWLEENMVDDLKYIANTKYCSDVVSDGDNYLAYTRIVTNKIPTLNCLGESFSSNVGLMTIDEVIMAGASPQGNNTNFYLYNKDIDDVWYTMSGAKGSNNANSKELYMFMVSVNGSILSNVEGKLYRKVRPVINIIKNATVSGDGTITNPYVIVK